MIKLSIFLFALLPLVVGMTSWLMEAHIPDWLMVFVVCEAMITMVAAHWVSKQRSSSLA